MDTVYITYSTPNVIIFLVLEGKASPWVVSSKGAEIIAT